VSVRALTFPAVSIGLGDRVEYELHTVSTAWWMAEAEHSVGEPRCDSSDPVLFTTSWDDGNPLDVRIADTLEEFGFVGTFYASTGPDGRRLIDQGDPARIGKKHELGAHGKTHTISPELTRSALADEIQMGGQRDVSIRQRRGRGGSTQGEDRGGDAPLHRPSWLCRPDRGIVGSAEVNTISLEATFQLYPHGWKTIIRNCVYRRELPIASLLVAPTRRGRRKIGSAKMLLAAAEQQRYVHAWGIRPNPAPQSLGFAEVLVVHGSRSRANTCLQQRRVSSTLARGEAHDVKTEKRLVELRLLGLACGS
jgi:hypothetical protein